MRFAGFLLAVFGNVASLIAIGNDDELIAGLRQAFESEDFDWRGRRRVLQCVAAVIEHGADLAVHIADDKVIAVMQRTVLNEDGGDGAASAIEFRFEDNAARSALGRGLEFLQICNEADHFHQEIEVGFLFRRDVDEDRRAAPVFRHEAAIGELLLHAIGHCFRLVDLVHRDDDWNFGGVSVIDGFESLRHDAVVGCDDEDDDVGGLRAAGTHAGKRFVTRRIEEDDLTAVRR